MGWQAIFQFRIDGVPAPGGSKKFVGFSKKKRPILVDDAKHNAPWRERVAWTAKAERVGCRTRLPLRGALRLRVDFVLPRPKGHLLKSGDVSPSAPRFSVVRPDATKLLRALEDALTGVVWLDDAQIVEQTVRKIYAASDEPPGAVVTVEQWR